MLLPPLPLPPFPITVTADVVDNGDGTYAVSYTASLAGVYELHITMGKCHAVWLACRAQLLVAVSLASGPLPSAASPV